MFDMDAIDALLWFGAGDLATGILAVATVTALATWQLRRNSNFWRRTWQGRCRICGCDDLHACSGADGLPCYWAEPDLCSECATAGGDAAAMPLPAWVPGDATDSRRPYRAVSTAGTGSACATDGEAAAKWQPSCPICGSLALEERPRRDMSKHIYENVPWCRACGWTPGEPITPFPDASAGATHIGVDRARGPSRTVTHTATGSGAAMPARPRKGGLS